MLAGNTVNLAQVYALMYVISVDEGESNDKTSIHLNGNVVGAQETI